MKHERLVKSSSRKLGAILTVSSLVMVNLLSPVAVLAQNTPQIQLEEGDVIHNPEDIELPELLDIGEHIDLTMFEVERGQLDLSDMEEPRPINQMGVEVGTFEELQRVIDEAVPDTALVITITESFAFNDVIFIRGGLDITLQSEGDYTLTQRNGRHFIVQSNSALTLRDGITLDGASQAGGIEVIRSMFTMEGGHITNNKSELGGGIYSMSAIINITGGSIEGNSADFGGGLCNAFGETNITGGFIAHNEADILGGGIFVNIGTLDISNATIAYNQGSVFGGGLMMIEGTANIGMNSLIEYNEAENGGGVYLAGVTTNIDSCRIDSNSARNGGGMYIHSGITNVVNTAYIINNSADFGGGIFLADGAIANMINRVTASNRATIAGGGVYIYHARLTLEVGDMLLNNAKAGGGIYINNGDMVMEGGSLHLNQADQGGGVVVGNLATFTLRSGGILNNFADIDRDVRVYPTGTFNHEGGVVGGW